MSVRTLILTILIAGCASSVESTTQSANPVPTTSTFSDTTLVVVDEAPQLIGGLRGLMREIGDLSQEMGSCRRDGRVLLQFMIDSEGKVYEIEIMEGMGGVCDQLAIRGIINSKFLPGKQYGQPVKVKMSLPIRFRTR